jgi:hypothetical protein
MTNGFEQAVRLKLSLGQHVRYWPKADIPSCTAHVCL